MKKGNPVDNFSYDCLSVTRICPRIPHVEIVQRRFIQGVTRLLRENQLLTKRKKDKNKDKKTRIEINNERNSRRIS